MNILKLVSVHIGLVKVFIQLRQISQSQKNGLVTRIWKHIYLKKVINLITFNLFYTQNDLVCILVLILPETIIPDSHAISTSTKNAKKATILRWWNWLK